MRLASMLSLLLLLLCACGAPQEPPRVPADDVRERARDAHERQRAPQDPAPQSQTAPRPQAVAHAEEPRALERNPAALMAHYPDARYFFGIGTHARDRHAAEASARAEVIRQIGTRTEAVLEVVVSGALEDAATTIREEIRETAAFERGELIRIDRARSGCDDEGCVAIAYLVRADAADTILEDVANALGEHRREVETALQTETPWHFTAPWRRARSLAEEIAPTAVLASMVATGEPTTVQAFRSRNEALADRRSELIREHVLAIDVVDLDRDGRMQARLEGAIRQALEAVGANTSSVGTCAQGARLSVASRMACSSAFVGVNCVIEGTLEGEHCTTQASLGRLALASCASASHPSSEERARESLANQIGNDTFSACIQDAVRHWWPIEVW